MYYVGGIGLFLFKVKWDGSMIFVPLNLFVSYHCHVRLVVQELQDPMSYDVNESE
jgi:hypothetical protein